MTRLVLAAGVAALALAAPAAAKPGERGGDRGGQAAKVSGGDHKAARAERGGHRAHDQKIEQRGGGQRFEARSFERGGERRSVQRIERGSNQRFAAFERGGKRDSDARIERRQQRAAKIENRIDRRQFRAEKLDKRIDRHQLRADKVAKRIERQQLDFDRRELRADRIAKIETKFRDRHELRSELARVQQARFVDFDDRDNFVRANGLVNGWCPPGLWGKNDECLPPGLAKRLVGVPLATTAGVLSLSALPSTMQYLYPDTDEHYYRWGNGYLYQVDRNDNLIDSILPLMALGLLPGQQFPSSYMNSYVPAYYGLSSFYPDYGNDCNRYGYGVIYEVDCFTGVVEDVIPLYAGGYGVGQMLPAGYSYYNVPTQYRDLYYPTNDYSYWYAPGAIYQVDPTSQLITAVASLLAPGLSVGQQLPAGYNYYNVPLDYRSTYYDTPTAWYRYNNGYIYQVDPTTQLVTAIVASLLT